MPTFYDFKNYGYLMEDVPKDILDDLKNEVLLLNEKSTRSNETLAGNIENEFFIPSCIPKIEPYILNLMIQYDAAYQYLQTCNSLTGNLPFSLADLWVNLQKKNEFNPVHNHSGIMSFVIWLEIPFDIEEEHQTSPGVNSNNNCPGHFEFLYTNTLGTIEKESIPVGKSYEGKIIMFPNRMMHCVYPFFTSEGERISISGNVRLKV